MKHWLLITEWGTLTPAQPQLRLSIPSWCKPHLAGDLALPSYFLLTFLSVCKWSNGVLSWNHQLNNTLFSYKSFGPGEPRKFYKVGIGHVPQKWSETALPVEAYEYTLGINSTRQDFNCVFVYTLPRRGKGRNISLIIVGLSGRQAMLT